MAILKEENLKWVSENEETVVGQLVLYHSPVSLADVILHPEKWNDSVIEKLRTRLEKSEGLLEVEKKKRSEEAAKKPKKFVKETPEESNSRIQDEKAQTTVDLVKNRHETKLKESELPE